MVFDVQELLKTDGARVRLEGKLTPPEAYQTDAVYFHADSCFSGQVENIGGVLELTAAVSGHYSSFCARCMKPLEEAYSISVSETLASENAEVTDRDAVLPLVGTSIDLDAVIWPAVLPELPTKLLCKQDCKGLCPQCGADLNESTCSCTADTIDPRWAALLDRPRE